MATYIGKNSDGFLTYENEPNAEQTLLKNINDTFPEEELNSIISEITKITETLSGEDVKSDLTITPDTNVSSCELLNAIKKDNNLYIQFTVTTTSDVAENSNFYIYIKGFKPAIHPTWRFGLSSSSTSFLMAWLSTFDETKGYRVLCKKLNTGTLSPGTFTFNGIIPLDTEV